MKPSEIQAVAMGDCYRALFISDIHGNFELLQRLLQKLRLQKEDFVFILGDMVEKGPRHLETLELLLRLSERPRTYFLMGNQEQYLLFRLECREESTAAMAEYVQKWPHGLVSQWAEREGLPLSAELFAEDPKRFGDSLRQIRETYREQIEFLAHLPVAIETEEYILVHGGIEERQDWKNSDSAQCIRHQDFLQSGKNLTSKWVVIGHMPVKNLVDSGPYFMAQVLENRRVIALDGGCGVLDAPKCQLNALEIRRQENGEKRYTYFFEDAAPQKQVIATYWPSPSIPVMKHCWPANRLELLKKGVYFSLCRQPETQKVGQVKNEHLEALPDGGYQYVCSSTSYRAQVNQGEWVGVLEEDCSGYTLIRRRDGLIGWIPKQCLAK